MESLRLMADLPVRSELVLKGVILIKNQ